MNLIISIIKLYLLGAGGALVLGYLTAQFIATKKTKKPFFFKFFKVKKETIGVMCLVAFTSWIGLYHVCKLFIKESKDV